MTKRSLLYIAILGLLWSACDSGSPDDPFIEPPPGIQEVPVSAIVTGGIVLRTNPSEIAPLTATLTFSTTEESQVRVQVLGAEPAVYEPQALAVDHHLPVLGLYPGVENQIEVRVTIPDSVYAADTIRVEAPPLPDFFPGVQVSSVNESLMEPGWTASAMFIGDAGVFRPYPIMFDSDGIIRWYLDLSFVTNPTLTVERLSNGNMLAGDGHDLYEYDMLGTQVNHWNIPGYAVHHDFVETPDGNLIIAVDKVGLATIEDHMIEFDPVSGAVVHEWDLREALDVDRFDWQVNEQDWLHVNAVVYDAMDDALVISGRNQAVFKVTRNNELVWILAPHRGWGKAGINGDGAETSDFLLTAVDQGGQPFGDAVQMGDTEPDDFGWSWGQHAPLFLPNGNLFLFDNGLNRVFSPDPPAYSRGVEYLVDESAMTVRQVWQYGKERGNEFYSFIISDVDYLPTTGNRLIMPGIIDPGVNPHALVTEVTTGSSQVVFEAKINFKNMLSTGTGFGQFDIVYRSERLPLYPPQD